MRKSEKNSEVKNDNLKCLVNVLPFLLYPVAANASPNLGAVMNGILMMLLAAILLTFTVTTVVHRLVLPKALRTRRLFYSVVLLSAFATPVGVIFLSKLLRSLSIGWGYIQLIVSTVFVAALISSCAFWIKRISAAPGK